RCAVLAKRLGVQHRIKRISWGSDIFPQRPSQGRAYELLARDCRYRLLFDTMVELDLDCIAMAHHMDDQIETMLMRHMKGTRGDGLAGMRPYRRWGMGPSNDPLHWFGLGGMKKWIIRPFLPLR